MKYRLLPLLAVLVMLPYTTAAQNGTRQGVVTLIEAGFAGDGVTPRYTLEANGADLRDVLTVLLRRAGAEFTIDQDVTGPISLMLRDKTLEEILNAVQRIAKPPILVRKGAVVTVVVAPPVHQDAAAQESAQAGRTTAPAGQAGRIRAVRTGGQASAQVLMPPLDQPITLSIPDDKPMPLRSVLQMIESQARIPVRLDPRVSGDVGVAARFTETPLSLVLDSLARTGSLKWQMMPDGRVLVAPSDWLLLSLRGIPVSGTPSVACPTCGRPALPAWRFCPYDGTPLSARRQQQGGQNRGR